MFKIDYFTLTTLDIHSPSVTLCNVLRSKKEKGTTLWVGFKVFTLEVVGPRVYLIYLVGCMVVVVGCRQENFCRSLFGNTQFVTLNP